MIVYYFTKWATAVPFRHRHAETIFADSFIEKFVSIFGLPLSLHSDQGTNFYSNIMADVCRILGINKTYSLPYGPQRDGLVERANRTIAAMFSAFVSDSK